MWEWQEAGDRLDVLLARTLMLWYDVVLKNQGVGHRSTTWKSVRYTCRAEVYKSMSSIAFLLFYSYNILTKNG
jgi:hypothetical protein